MNMNKQQIIEYNNTKINYFNLLVKNNKIAIDCDIVVDKINPSFSKKISTLEYISNIICRKYIHNLLYNFRMQTENYLKNKSIRNFENLLNINREKINKHFIKQLTDTLKLSNAKIPTSKTLNYHYIVHLGFYGDSFMTYLCDLFLSEEDYDEKYEYSSKLTLKELKNSIITEFTNQLTDASNTYLIDVYRQYLQFGHIMKVKHTLSIDINIDISLFTNISMENELEKLF